MIVSVIILSLLITLYVWRGITPEESAERVIKIYSCTEISSPGVYSIASDLKSTGVCLKVSASNVIIDGNGFLVGGGEYGIYVMEAVNVSILDLRIRGSDFGIYIKDSKDVWLNNIKVENCGKIGIVLASVSDSGLENITLRGNGAGLVIVGNEKDVDTYLLPGEFKEEDEKSTRIIVLNVFSSENNIDGIFLYNTVEAILRNCTSNSNSGGIYLFYSKNIVIENCSAADNEFVGVMLDNCNYCQVKNSIVRRNAGGIRLDYSNHCVLEGNVAEDNLSDGIVVWRESSNNKVLRNVIRGGEHGLRIIKSNNNLIEGNVISSSSRCDICVGPGLHNTFINNKYVTMKEVEEVYEKPKEEK